MLQIPLARSRNTKVSTMLGCSNYAFHMAVACCMLSVAVAVEVSTSQEFASAAQSALDGETIKLRAGSYSEVCGIHLTKSLTIDGIGHVELDCGGRAPHFVISGIGVQVALTNLGFTSGHTVGSGGCLTVSDGAHLDVTACSFSDCIAAQRGGAISVEAAATVRLSQTTFTGCSAQQGGAVSVRGQESKVAMEDCKLLNNTASLDGGGVLVESSHLDITGANFFQENSALHGGGIAAKQIVNSTDAFAVSISSGAEFHSNFAHPAGTGLIATGGAIDLAGFGSFVSSGSVVYDGNSALEAEAKGGTFYINGPMTFLLKGNAVVTRSFTQEGGAMYVNTGAYVEVRDGPLFSYNYAITYGGAIYVLGVGTLVQLENGVVLDHNDGIAGGGICVGEGPNLNLFNNINVTNNVARRFGGGLFIFFLNHLETRGSVRVHDNYTPNDGAGMIVWMVCTVNLTAGASFKGNVADRGGAGIRTGPDTFLYADGVSFTDNRVTSAEPSAGGGALLCQQGTMHLTNCYFARNYALVAAAIAWAGGGDCTHSRFEHHVAGVGAGVSHLSDMPVTLDNIIFYNNSARTDGGCVVSAEASVLQLGSCVLDRCSAGGSGAAMLVKDAAAVHVTGHVLMQHGTAGGLGGGIHHQGKLLAVEEAATLTVTRSSARAGGGLSSTNAVSIRGQLSVTDNLAREGDGGGVQGLGVLAVTTVAESGWLEVTRNEAAAGNGGGVALLDNARLAFDMQTGCAAACAGLGNGICDSTCMAPECRWDGGDCAVHFLDAGEEASKPCVRDSPDDYKCPMWSLDDGDTSTLCFTGCLLSSCDFGFGSRGCASAVEAMAECPYVNALIYASVTTADVRYVQDGGTAGGFGRCESDTCSPADAAIGRDEPYCTTINDGGRALELACPGCTATVDVGESWGPCAPPEKPRLPHVGFDYDPDEMRAVLALEIPSVLRRYPGCGHQPMSITSNRAGLAGGGVYKDRCEAFLESADRCFVGELDNKRLPTAVISLADNQAGGPGGGFFVDCPQMSACLHAMAAQSGLPMRADTAQPLMHFGGQSAAGAYGMEAAGPPQELEVSRVAGNYTPGQALIDLEYRLLDSQRQTVRGSAAWPNPHLVEVSVCRVGEDCAALQPPFILRSHATDEVTSIRSVLVTLAVCPVDDPRVEIHVRVAGASAAGLHKSVVVGCETCGAGQEMVLHGEGAAQTYICRSCQPNEYVVTATGGCQPCPLEGASCDGLALTPTVPGAEWVAEGETMRVAACPAGYVLVRDPNVPVLDTCIMCPPGSYSVRPARYPDTLAVGRAAEAPQLCSECVRGADCLGGQRVVALPGFWQDQQARPARRAAEPAELALYQCSPGACEGNNSCGAGRHGPVCGLCDERWGRSGLKCVYCGTEADSSLGQPKHVPSFIVTVVVGALVVYLLTCRPLCVEWELALRAACGCAPMPADDTLGDEAQATESRVAALRRYVSNIQWTSPAMIGAFKVAISFYQVASTFPLTFRITWPDEFNVISSLGRLTGLDLSLLLPSVSCMTRDKDYIEGLVIFTMAFPIIMTCVLCCPYLVTRALGAQHHGGSRAHPKHDVMQRYCLRAVLLWLFLIYPTVSEHSLSTFLCEDLGSGGHVLVMDKSVECPWGGGAPAGAFYFALFLVLLYPVGIPAFFYYVVSAFFVPAMAEAKYRAALFGELVKLYRRETSTPITIKLAQHVGALRQGSDDGAPSPGAASTKVTRQESEVSGAMTRQDSNASETAVPLQAFKRRVSQLFTHTFVQRELSGQVPEPALYDQLQHVLEQFGCGDEDLVRVVTVLKRLSISTSLDSELNAFEQLAAKIAHNHLLFTGHETLEQASAEQLQALFLFDWEGLNRKRSEREIRRVRARRQRVLNDMDHEQLRVWVLAKARGLEKASRITVPTLNWNGETEEEERALGFVGFLFDDFRVQTWWFFLLGELCKLIMTSVLAFIPGRFWQQLAWGFFVQVCVTWLYVVFRPMAEQWLNDFQVYALGVQCAILFFGLLLAFSDPYDPDQQAAFSPWAYFLVVLKWSLPFYPLALMLLGKAARQVHARLQRAAGGGGDEGVEEREATCLELVLFPTTANNKKRLHRFASLVSETSVAAGRGLRRSVSDEEILGYESTGAGSPRRLVRQHSSVDAQLVSADLDPPAATPRDPFSTPREPFATPRHVESAGPSAGRGELAAVAEDCHQGEADAARPPTNDRVEVELSVLPTPRQ